MGEKKNRPRRDVLVDQRKDVPSTLGELGWFTPNGTVSVSVYAAQRVVRNVPQEPWIRVSVWDNDDTGMIKLFETVEAAKKFYDSTPSVITYGWLMDNGFKPD